MSQDVEVTVRIKLRYPLDEIGRLRLRGHIIDAVGSWGGSLHPDDLLFDGVEKVTTSGVRSKT